jgi:hypothetical protein
MAYSPFKLHIVLTSEFYILHDDAVKLCPKQCIHARRFCKFQSIIHLSQYTDPIWTKFDGDVHLYDTMVVLHELSLYPWLRQQVLRHTPVRIGIWQDPKPPACRIAGNEVHMLKLLRVVPWSMTMSKANWIIPNCFSHDAASKLNSTSKVPSSH